MLALLNSIRNIPTETPDTGTFADGAFHMPRVELRSQAKQDGTRSAHARDYGADRKVAPAFIGYV